MVKARVIPRRFLAVALVLAIGMPSAQASPRIAIYNRSHYFKHIDRRVLTHYLSAVSTKWDIYQGTYEIYLYDYMPSFLIIDPRAIGGHTAEVKAYINAKALSESGLSIYYVLTHELAEMATDPHLDRYCNGELLEIADPVRSEEMYIDNQQVASFVSPDFCTQTNPAKG